MGLYSRHIRTQAIVKHDDVEIIRRIDNLLSNTTISSNVYSFLSSIKFAFQKYNGLTTKQYSAFTKIEKSYIDVVQSSELNKQWNEDYANNKKEIAIICAGYYASNPPYYGDLSHRIIKDAKFIPTREQYESITTNKYALKVLHSHYATAKYKIGDLIMLRASCPEALKLRIGVIPCAIVKVNSSPIVSAAKGAKNYNILPLGKTHIITIEERWIKKAKNNC